MLTTFFILYVSQVFVFDIMGSHGIPFRGGVKIDKQPWSLLPEIPNYFAMAMVGFLPCKKTLWQLNRRQVFSAIFVATIDLMAQCLSKTGQVMLDTLTVYIIINSAFSIIFTAVGARCVLGKKLNWGQYLGILIVIGGVVISAYAKAGQKAAEEAIIEKDLDAQHKKEKEAAEAAAEGAYMFGLLLVVLSTVADGVGFVANEKLMNEGVRSIPGTLLCCLIGIWNSSVLLLWQVFYTFPRWDEIITQPLHYLWDHPDPKHGVETPIHTYGRADVIFKCILYIFVSGFFCRVATMYLLKHVGAITFVVIKMLKIGAVAVLSVLLGREEFDVMKTIAASVITFGVGVYSYAKIRAILDEKTTCKAAELDSQGNCVDSNNDDSSNDQRMVNVEEITLSIRGSDVEKIMTPRGSRRGGNNTLISPRGSNRPRGASNNTLSPWRKINGDLVEKCTFQNSEKLQLDKYNDLESADNAGCTNNADISLNDATEDDSETKPFLYTAVSNISAHSRRTDALANGGGGNGEL